MTACHDHNLRRALPKNRPYGIRVRLPAGDPLTRILGANWEKHHWYETPSERDRALAEFSERHLYSRPGDRPTLVFEKVDR